MSENKAGSFQLQSVTTEMQLGRQQWKLLSYHQTQQWSCCHISLDSSTSGFAKARHPLTLLGIVSAGVTSERSQRDNYPLPYTTSKLNFTLFCTDSISPLLAGISAVTVLHTRQEKTESTRSEWQFLFTHTLPPAQLQVKGACWHQRGRWKCWLSITTEKCPCYIQPPNPSDALSAA